MTFEFTVFGNHLGRFKNPVPFHASPPMKKARKDGTTYFIPNIDPQAKKYKEYTYRVRKAFADCLYSKEPLLPIKAIFTEEIKTLTTRHRRKKDGKIDIYGAKKEFYHLNMVYFYNDARADAENIGKGIVDAIHLQDKYAHIASPWTMDPENPRVEVLITNNHFEFLDRIYKFYVDRAVNLPQKLFA